MSNNAEATITLIDRAIESAKCRIYRLKQHGDATISHQKKAENQQELMRITIKALELYKNTVLEVGTENAPAVDVDIIRHATWEEQSDGTHFCSHCGYEAPFTYDGQEFEPTRCYHCGSLMDLEDVE